MAPSKTNEWAARHINVLLSAVNRGAPFASKEPVCCVRAEYWFDSMTTRLTLVNTPAAVSYVVSFFNEHCYIDFRTSSCSDSQQLMLRFI